jgi:nucleotide-binding universal stress UspA family protein
MYHTILAPLDGSKLAECSLEHIKELAAGCRVARIVLLSVVESVKTPTWWPEDRALSSAMSAELDKREAQIHDRAELYLAGVARELKQLGIEVKTEVAKQIESQPVAAVILEYAQMHNIDLIIMSTHGRSGISRWSLGSVADRVLSHSAVPVLTVAPKGCRIPLSS